MELLEAGITSRIHYNVKVSMYEVMGSFSTHISMEIENHTPEEVDNACSKVKAVVRMLEQRADTILKDKGVGG